MVWSYGSQDLFIRVSKAAGSTKSFYQLSPADRKLMWGGLLTVAAYITGVEIATANDFLFISRKATTTKEFVCKMSLSTAEVVWKRRRLLTQPLSL